MFVALAFVCAAEPQFTVVNKCPPVVVNKMPVPGVAGRTFQSVRGHSSHFCPGCGRFETRVSAGSPYGFHTHTCPKCLLVWSH